LVSKTFIRDVFITQVSSSGLDVYQGDRTEGIFIGSVFPTGMRGTDPNVSEKTFELNGEMTDIMLYMPKNEILDRIEIGVDDDAEMDAPTPYENEKPVIFYGSSIVHGSAATRPGLTYPAMISRDMNLDFRNFLDMLLN
jgi:hypothetical protein